jgi:dTDP-4-dehydrorhamnose reductase
MQLSAARQAVRGGRRVLSTHIARDGSRVSSQFDAGPGGYSSNKGITATVFGATGFVGRYVVDKLASQGITVIVPFRGDDLQARHLKLMGDLGRVNPVPYDPRVVDSVRTVVRPSQLVVNLIGKDFETKHVFGSLTKNYTYEQVHAEVPRMIAQVCAEQGVGQLIHMSSLAARPGVLSKVEESRLLGELAVRAHFPNATILKPANIFGDEDRFMNQIGRMARALPYFALVNGGKARLQPVYVRVPQHRENDRGTQLAVGGSSTSFRRLMRPASNHRCIAGAVCVPALPSAPVFLACLHPPAGT